MGVININEILNMNVKELSSLNLHSTATKNVEQIDEEGLKALIGEHSRGPNGAESTEKVFFTQGLEDGYLLLVNKIFSVFRNALVRPDEYGLKRYLTIKGININEIEENELKDMLNQDDFIKDFWETTEIKELKLTEGATIQQGLIEFGLRKFSAENYVEYEDAKNMHNVLLENGIGNTEFAPDILPSSLKKSFFYLVEQSTRNQSSYKLDLQENIDYFSGDKDEETGRKMAKYNMHTISGKGIPKEKMHRIVGKDGRDISMFDVTMYLCQKYKELHPNSEFPSIVSSSGYKEECWMDEFYSQYSTKFYESQIEKKTGLEDCMQDDGVRSSATQIATRIVKDAVLGRDENSREEENDIGE